MSEYVRTNDTVHFTVNFYHPQSGFSIAADATPRYLVYESGATLILQGNMTARTPIVGSYWANFVASAANGFDNHTFYDVQVSGAVIGLTAFALVKTFVLNDIYDVNTVQISGEYVRKEDIGAAGSLTAAAVADAVWDELPADHQSFGSAGSALTAASGNVYAGVLATPTNITAGTITTVTNLTNAPTAGDFTATMKTSIGTATWTTPSTRTITGGTVDNLTNFPSGAVADAVWDEQIATHGVFGTAGRALTAASGNVYAGVLATPTNITAGTITNLTNFPSGAVADAVWDEVLGEHQTIGTTGYALNAASGNLIGSSSGPTSADIADAVWNETLGDHQTIGSTGYALNTASGNLIGTPGGVTAADVWSYSTRELTSYPSGAFADAIWDEQIATHSVFGTAGRALTAASGNVYAGVLATPTNITAGTITTVGTVNALANDSITANALATTAVDEIVDQVWNELLSGHIATGSTGDALNQASGVILRQGATGTGLTAIPTIANVTTVANLTNFPSGAVADAVWDEQIATHGVFGTAGRALTAASGNDFIGVHASPTNITAGTITTVTTTTNLTNFPSGAVADAVWDEQIATHGVFGTAGRALTAASGNDFVGTHASPTNITAGTITTVTNLTNFPSGAVADAVWDELISQHQVAGTAGQTLAVASGINSNIYFAAIKYTHDFGSDEFAAHWFKNDQPISSGALTSPFVSVYNTTNGNALVSHQPMQYASPALGVVRYNTPVTALASGEPYLVSVSGTIDGVMRTWSSLVGIDLL